MRFGYATYHEKKLRFVDIPGTYSLLSHSEEEEIARDYICFSRPDVTVVIVDATCFELGLPDYGNYTKFNCMCKFIR